MDQSRGVYDKSLLRQASTLRLPDADDAKQHRHSYDRNLLKESVKVHLQPNRSRIHNRLGVPDVHHSKTKPFWRTTRGRAVIALVFLAVVGTIVGMVVGATMRQKRLSSSSSVSPVAAPGDIPGTDDTVPITNTTESSFTFTSLPSLVGRSNVNITTVTVTPVPSSSASV